MADPDEWDAYERISDDPTEAGEGVKRQREDTDAAVAARGGRVVMHHVENNTSAYKKQRVELTDQYKNTYGAYRVMRPVWAEALQRLRSGEAKRLMVYDLDRLARDPRDLEDAIECVEHYGAEIRSATASGVDLSTHNGIMSARLMVMMANKSSADTGRRVSRQKAQRAAEGKPHKGRHRLFGYTGDWTRDETEAAVVSEMFQRRANGESTTSIAKDLTQRGVRTVSGREWTSGTLGETLKKTVYKGRVSYKGQEVADSIYPALVDAATFDAAQAHLANDSAGTNARRYLLSGILICGHDLIQMKGNPSNEMYRCAANYGGCGKLSVRIQIADAWALWAAMNKHHEQPAKSKDNPRDFQVEIDALTAEIEHVRDMVRHKVYDFPTGTKEIAELNKKLAGARREAAKAVPKVNRVTGNYLDYHRMNLSQQRVFITDAISKIEVSPAISRGNQPFNPGRFTFHFADGTSYAPTLEDSL